MSTKALSIMEVAPRRSLRQSLSMASSMVSSPAQTRNYVLNVERALKKKAIVCQADVKISHEEKEGNNHVFEMSAGIFEIYKLCALRFFDACNQNTRLRSSYNIRHIKDQTGSVVETQVRVYQRTKPPSKNLKYTMNFYHTTCRILVNGKKATQYLTDHKEVVKSVLSYPQLSTLDSDLLTLIHEKLNQMSNSRRKRLPVCSAGKDNGAEEQLAQVSMDCPVQTPSQRCLEREMAVSLREDVNAHVSCVDGMGDVSADEADWACVHCSEATEGDCIECSKCHEWMHWSCEKLTESKFQEHIANPDSEYTCLLCKHEESNDGLVDVLACVSHKPGVDSDPGDPTSIISSPSAIVPLAGSSDGDSVLLHSPSSSDNRTSNAVGHAEPISQVRSAIQATDQRLPSGMSPPSEIHLDDDHHPDIHTVESTVKLQLTDINKPRSSGDHRRGRHTSGSDSVLTRGDELKEKEKLLAAKERRLKDLQKKLSSKEISLNDTVDRMEYSKVFISQLESKIKELQSSNRLYKLKLLSSHESADCTDSHGAGNQSEATHSRPVKQLGGVAQHDTYQICPGTGPQLGEMNSRLLSLEMKMLEGRLEMLEWSNRNLQHEMLRYQYGGPIQHPMYPYMSGQACQSNAYNANPWGYPPSYPLEWSDQHGPMTVNTTTRVESQSTNSSPPMPVELSTRRSYRYNRKKQQQYRGGYQGNSRRIRPDRRDDDRGIRSDNPNWRAPHSERRGYNPSNLIVCEASIPLVSETDRDVPYTVSLQTSCQDKTMPLKSPMRLVAMSESVQQDHGGAPKDPRRLESMEEEVVFVYMDAPSPEASNQQDACNTFSDTMVQDYYEETQCVEHVVYSKETVLSERSFVEPVQAVRLDASGNYTNAVDCQDRAYPHPEPQQRGCPTGIMEVACHDHAYSHAEPSQRGCSIGIMEMTCQDHPDAYSEPSQWGCSPGVMEMNCQAYDYSHPEPSQRGRSAGGMEMTSQDHAYSHSEPPQRRRPAGAMEMTCQDHADACFEPSQRGCPAGITELTCQDHNYSHPEPSQHGRPAGFIEMTCQDHAYSHSEPSQRGCPTGVMEVTCQDRADVYSEPSQRGCPASVTELTYEDHDYSHPEPSQRERPAGVIVMTCQDHAYSHSEPSQRGCHAGVIEMTCQDYTYFHPEPSQRGCPNSPMEMTFSVDSETCMAMDHHQGPSQGGGGGLMVM